MVQRLISQTDALTGLLNRKAFQEEFRAILSKARKDDTPVSIALLDIDNFLRINQTYGHAGGDEVLKAVAETMQATAGPEALVVRYGGDEFALLFQGVEREQAFLVLEKTRQAIENCQVKSEGQLVEGLHISAGLASFPIDGRAESELLRKADHALYRAKETGRNRIRLAIEEKMTPKTTHYTQTQLERLSKLSQELGVGEAELLREALDMLLRKHGVTEIERFIEP